MKENNSFEIVVQTEHQNIQKIFIGHDLHAISEMKTKTCWKVFIKNTSVFLTLLAKFLPKAKFHGYANT